MPYKQEYNKEDLEAFKRKDQLNARMSALKAVAANHEGKELGDIYFRQEADLYYKWLIQDQVWGDTLSNTAPTVDKPKSVSNTSSSSLPVPTVDQKKWLDNIQQKYGFTAEQVFGVLNKYPSNKDEAVKVTQLLKNK